MTVQTFDRSTIWNKRGKPATVRIDSGRQGRIVFSVEAVKLLGLKAGMRIAFRTYSTDERMVYFYEQATGMKLQVMQEVLSGQMMAVYCRPLCVSLLNHLGFNGSKPVTFDVKPAMAQMPETNCMAWMISRKNKHKPLKTTAK